MNTTLIIMAAGIGSRFGTGIKQLAKMAPNGEIIMDFSIYDAKESLRKESKVVQTKKQYGDFSLTALSFASISIFSG